MANTGWLMADKVVRLGVGLFVGVWVARYLGPGQFGLMNYAMAIVALFGTVAGLGLNGIVVRDLVRKPEEASVTLGTAFLLQLIAGFAAFVLAVGAVSILRPADEVARAITAVLGFTLVFKAAEVAKYWFESRVSSRYTVLAENAVFLIMSATRVALIMAKAPLMAFVFAALAEAALIGAALLLVHARKADGLLAWHVSMLRARSLLTESWPLILGAMASMINMRMDQVILGAMVDDVAVGNYSAAARLAEVWLIVPGIIGSSIYPAIISAKENSEEVYRARILRVVKLMAAVVLPVAFIISILSGRIIHLVYGQEYAPAGNYLAIYIWTGVPYLIFFVLNQMFYIEGLLKIGFVVSVFSVASNLSLNFLLIPVFGGIGAAIATLVTAVGSTLLSVIILNSKTGIFFGRNRK